VPVRIRTLQAYDQMRQGLSPYISDERNGGVFTDHKGTSVVGEPVSNVCLVDDCARINRLCTLLAAVAKHLVSVLSNNLQFYMEEKSLDAEYFEL